MNIDFSFSHSLETCLQLFKRHPGLIIASFFLYWICTTPIGWIGGGLAAVLKPYGIVSNVVAVIFLIMQILVGLALLAGLIQIALKLIDGQEVRVVQLFSRTDLLFELLAAVILMGLIGCVSAIPFGIWVAITSQFFTEKVWLGLFGIVLFMIPIAYVTLKYMFIPLVIVDQNFSVFDAFSESARLTKGKKLHMLLLFFQWGLFSLVALFPAMLFLLPAVLLQEGVLYFILSSLATVWIFFVAWLFSMLMFFAVAYLYRSLQK